MKIGSHVGMKAPDYLLGSVNEASSYNATALMLYSGAPQNTRRSPIDKLKVDEFKESLKANNIAIEDVIVHAPYIINLANTVDMSKSDFAQQFLREEIDRVQAIGAKIIVLHPGSHVKAGEEAGINRIIEGLNNVLKADDDVIIALETMAGKGSEVGYNFEQIKTIIDGVKYQEKMGVCFDSCHLNDAGYDLSDFDAVLDEFDEIVGLDRLVCLHLNDSKNEQGARKDRHENIGHGTIGFDILCNIAHNPRIKDVPKILETPFINGEAPYKAEIEMLKNKQFVDIVNK